MTALYISAEEPQINSLNRLFHPMQRSDKTLFFLVKCSVLLQNEEDRVDDSARKKKSQLCYRKKNKNNSEVLP